MRGRVDEGEASIHHSILIVFPELWLLNFRGRVFITQPHFFLKIQFLITGGILSLTFLPFSLPLIKWGRGNHPKISIYTCKYLDPYHLPWFYVCNVTNILFAKLFSFYIARSLILQIFHKKISLILWISNTYSGSTCMS